MAPAVVILTGAGISAESGLATFRDPDGIWSRVRIEDVATPDAFARDPARVHAFYNARRRQIIDPAIPPNAAHRALARLEAAWAAPFLLVTQNVDDLHARAGSLPSCPGAEFNRLSTCCQRIRGTDPLVVHLRLIRNVTAAAACATSLV